MRREIIEADQTSGEWLRPKFGRCKKMNPIKNDMVHTCSRFRTKLFVTKLFFFATVKFLTLVNQQSIKGCTRWYVG